MKNSTCNFFSACNQYDRLLYKVNQTDFNIRFHKGFISSNILSNTKLFFNVMLNILDNLSILLKWLCKFSMSLYTLSFMRNHWQISFVFVLLFYIIDIEYYIGFFGFLFYCFYRKDIAHGCQHDKRIFSPWTCK